MRATNNRLNGDLAVWGLIFGALIPLGALGVADLLHKAEQNQVDPTSVRIAALAQEIAAVALQEPGSTARNNYAFDTTENSYGVPVMSYVRKCGKEPSDASTLKTEIGFDKRSPTNWTTTSDDVNYVSMERRDDAKSNNYEVILDKTAQGWAITATVPGKVPQEFDPSVSETNPNGDLISDVKRNMLSADAATALINFTAQAFNDHECGRIVIP